ncbi:hypothetical protein CRG98_005901 [Punica granatum]|uniref:MADS-box domain-containing protein n=1 Tax=Punica granatum TaxID=22663 RepID=A0A2I0KZ99_PUNGR|nr:hypothetical protein CRG98_005901 [Punica granatum]
MQKNNSFKTFQAKGCKLSGAQIGIVVFSSTGKPFSFGQPTMDAQILEAWRRERIWELSQTLDETLTQLTEEKKHKKSLAQLIKETEAGKASQGEVGWWEAKIDELSPPQLKQVSKSIEQFCGDLKNHMNQRNDGNQNNNYNSNVVGNHDNQNNNYNSNVKNPFFALALPSFAALPPLLCFSESATTETLQNPRLLCPPSPFSPFSGGVKQIPSLFLCLSSLIAATSGGTVASSSAPAPLE